MFNKKLAISLIIFSTFMFLTSIIKTQTRLVEKNIFIYKEKIANIENNFHEAQLDFYYLSSPDSISKKIQEYSSEEYSSIKYSTIYFSLEQFLKLQANTTNNNIDEKNKKK
jgi:hypothetical protein|tara:strand:+ start:2411 stop:2743 length:333 start_codon:yes stop_codon:yes gene_type:complete